MFEKVNPSHPDKIADRIVGAIVDLSYTKEQNPKTAVEVLIGHGKQDSKVVVALYQENTYNKFRGLPLTRVITSKILMLILVNTLV